MDHRKNKKNKSSHNNKRNYSSSKQPVYTVAIIVPFRDLEREESATEATKRTSKKTQKWNSENIHEFHSKSRTEQLLVFQEYMSQHFLPFVSGQFEAQQEEQEQLKESIHEKSKLQFVMIVVEQSRDGKLFNRGKLLNVGFQVCLREKIDWVIFHDVDLFPTNDIWELYAKYPHHPIHIGKLFTRYNHNMQYFGGIVSMTETQFRAIGGFPNTFFGWGGEDECHLFRLKVYRMYDPARDLASSYLLKAGSGKFLHDAEGFANFEKKKKQLDDHDERSMIKFELQKRETKANTFLIDGLPSLVYTLEQTPIYDTKSSCCWVVHYHVNIAQSFFVPHDCSGGFRSAEFPNQLPSFSADAATGDQEFILGQDDSDPVVDHGIAMEVSSDQNMGTEFQGPESSSAFAAEGGEEAPALTDAFANTQTSCPRYYPPPPLPSPPVGPGVPPL